MPVHADIGFERFGERPLTVDQVRRILDKRCPGCGYYLEASPRTGLLTSCSGDKLCHLAPNWPVKSIEYLVKCDDLTALPDFPRPAHRHAGKEIVHSHPGGDQPHFHER